MFSTWKGVRCRLYHRRHLQGDGPATSALVWDGNVGTLFAYGQTGSGKTFSISRLERLVARDLFDGSLSG